MSTTEEKLVAILAPLASSRVYPEILPQDPTYPAITYTVIDPGAQYSLSGASGLSNPHIQVDCWASTRSSVKSLAVAVKSAMDTATTFKGLLVAGRSMYEEDPMIYRESMDFSIWDRS